MLMLSDHEIEQIAVALCMAEGNFTPYMTDENFVPHWKRYADEVKRFVFIAGLLKTMGKM